ncbi:TPA: hypothetical protein MXT12_001245 [Clostridioides difficile]|nr:hypothetical protein [Clostridioides difficile]
MQWALSSEEIDIAIICKDAAKQYVNVNSGFEIVGTVVQNSDIFLLSDNNPEKIGVIQNRDYQSELVKKYYKNVEVAPLLGTTLAYGLESNLVDGVVIDCIKSIGLEGKRKSTTKLGDYDTYVLVVNKEFKKSKAYSDFITLYNKSVDALKNKATFKKVLKEYRNIRNIDMEEISNWKLKFLKIKAID